MFRFSKCQWGPEMCPGAFREKSRCPAKASKTTSARRGALRGRELGRQGPALPGDESSIFGGSRGWEESVEPVKGLGAEPGGQTGRVTFQFSVAEVASSSPPLKAEWSALF